MMKFVVLATMQLLCVISSVYSVSDRVLCTSICLTKSGIIEGESEGLGSIFLGCTSTSQNITATITHVASSSNYNTIMLQFEKESTCLLGSIKLPVGSRPCEKRNVKCLSLRHKNASFSMSCDHINSQQCYVTQWKYSSIFVVSDPLRECYLNLMGVSIGISCGILMLVFIYFNTAKALERAQKKVKQLRQCLLNIDRGRESYSDTYGLPSYNDAISYTQENATSYLQLITTPPPPYLSTVHTCEETLPTTQCDIE